MEEDPGWPWARRIPRGEPPGGLLAIRVIFSSFVAGVVLFGIVTMFIVSSSKTESTNKSVAFPLVILGIATLLMVASRKIRIPLDFSDAEKLSGTYRGRVIIRTALAEGATLLGFVGFLASRQWWMVPVAALIGVVGFMGAAPTAHALAREQERLEAEGCPLSLTAALNSTPGTRSR